jgi:hypothetical protein
MRWCTKPPEMDVSTHIYNGPDHQHPHAPTMGSTQTANLATKPRHPDTAPNAVNLPAAQC